jgi:capsular exopolysaccharide synthesis family protein
LVPSDAPPDQSRALTRRSSYGYGGYGTPYPTIPAKPADENPESGGLLEYWRILRLHKGTWVVFAALGAFIGFLVTLPQTPIYQAKTAIEIQNLNDNFMNMRQSTQVYEPGGGADSSEIPTQIRILQSDTLMERVIAQLKTDAVHPSTSSRLATWRQLLNIPEPDAPRAADSAFNSVARSTKARAAGQTRVIEITADSPDPRLAATFLNTLTAKFIDQNLESRWKSTEKTADWLSRQLDDMRVKLERSEDNLQQYARAAGLMFTSDEKTNVSEEKLKQLQQELSTASSARIARQSTFELAQQSPPEALPDVLNDATLRETASKMRDLRAQIADLSAIYTPDYAKVRRAQAELNALQTTFTRDRAAILGRIQNEYKDALRREQLLQAAYSAQAQQVTGEGEKSIQYNILKREVDSNRQLYDSMLAQLKQSSIASAMRASNVRIVDAAKIPAKPYKPDLQQSLGVGALAGIFLGAAFIITRSRADRTIQQPGESAIYLDLPELGIIPSGNKLRAAISTANGIPGAKPSQERIELAALSRKSSSIAEGFRSALISILFSDDQVIDVKTRTIVLASASPGEGKSTITSNLAIAIAEVGRKVLLIDADMRRPRQHEVFSVDNEFGLSNLLRDKTPLNGDVTLGGLIQQTHVPGLWILPSGPGTTSATNLLYSSHMSSLMHYLKEEFDAILIDTPPMLQIPDARVVARLADSVIMVVRAQQTSRDALVAACQRFSEDGTKVLGTILNDWNPKSSPNGYYGYDKSYGRYGRYYSHKD